MLGLQKALEDLLEGRVSPQNADKRILHWAELMIYKRACALLDIPNKEARKKDLDTIPDNVRPFVEREAIRLWNIRRMK